MRPEILEGGRRLDDNGIIMPWYTSPCLEWLEVLDLNSRKIFEFGAGDSTKWYKSKKAFPFGVDSNKDWVDDRAVVLCTTKDEYLLSIYDLEMVFDIIVIDGDYRDECTKHALNSLRSGGYLIIDNYLQPSVDTVWTVTPKLIEGMPITIYKEPNHEDWQTAVIIKP